MMNPIEEDSGLMPATMAPKRFKAALEYYVDMDRFELRAQSNAARLAA